MTTKRVPLHEVIELLESGQDLSSVEIILFPPEDGHVTEEESGDEDDYNINHLPGGVLRSVVEVSTTRSAQEIPTDVLISEEVSSIDKTDSSEKTKNTINKKVKKVAKRQECHRKWCEDENKFTQKSGNADNAERKVTYFGEELSCLECFEKFFSPEIIQLIVEQSNYYAMTKNHSLALDESEIKVYISVLLLTGYMTPKYTRMFWELQSDRNIQAASSSIRRNRFLEIQQFLHLEDNNNLPKNDKFNKVRRYLHLLESNFIKCFELMPTAHISVDESMVPYYGKHSSKQHIHGKPIKFGYKIWAAASREGYLVCFEPYQGSKTAPLPMQEELGLGRGVIMELHSRLPAQYKPYNLYFDRYFSSLKLIEKLYEENIGATGTIMENRTQKCPLVENKVLQKKERGTMSYKNTQNYLIVKWHDNNLVIAISNCHSISPITKVDRIGFVGKKKQKIQVMCPNTIKKYNAYMGGVDRFDENVDSMRIGHRGRKWWYPLFSFGIDAACQNAWLFKRFTSNETITYCDFRSAVVQAIFYKYGKHPQRIHNIPKRSKTSNSKKNEHEISDSRQRRCVQCHNRTRKMFTKCNVALHIHCFHKFHTNL